MVWLKWVVIALVALVVLVFALGAFGSGRWAAATRALHDRLEAARVPVTPARYDAARELEGLPPPVQRYFRAALKDGQAMVEAAAIEHTGTFNFAADGPDQWKPFRSKQRVAMRRPGLVWDARMPMLPGVTVHVHDVYVAGEGILHPAVMGLVSLANVRGTSPEAGGIAEGEFMRWLAEAAWYPTALLPSQGVRWSAIDDRSARATMSDGALKVTLDFTFDAGTGLIETVRAQARGRTVGDKVELTPWEGRWTAYAERDGMKVPMEGEVAWLTAQGRRAYWRGTVTALAFTLAR